MKIQKLEKKTIKSKNKNKKAPFILLGFTFSFIFLFVAGLAAARILTKKGLMTVNFSVNGGESVSADIPEPQIDQEMWAEAGLPVLKLFSDKNNSPIHLADLGTEETLVFLSESNKAPVGAVIQAREEESAEKISYHLRLAEEKSLSGMRDFDLIFSPSMSYGYLAFQNNAKKEKLIIEDQTYIYLDTDDEFEGVYLLKETMKGKSCLGNSEDRGLYLWINPGNDQITETLSPLSLDYSFVLCSEDSSGEEKYSQVQTLLEDYSDGKVPFEEVFDISKLGKYYALIDLWKMDGERGYFYYDPETKLLEPVLSDLYFSFNELDINSKISDFVSDWFFNKSLVRASYTEALYSMTREDYLDWENIIDQSEEILDKTLFENYGADLSDCQDFIDARRKVLGLELTPYQTVHGSYMFLEGNSQILRIDLANMMLLPVEITAVEINDFIIPMDSEMLSISESGSLSSDYKETVLEPLLHSEDFAPEPLHLNLNLEKLELGQSEEDISVVRVLTKIVGMETEISNDLVFGEFPQTVNSNVLPFQPSLAEVLSAHPYLEYSEGENSLIVLPGDWNVMGDLILPDGIGLKILPGTTLRFAEEKILYSNAPINIEGSLAEPAYLTAQNGSWGGIAVIKAGDLSEWNFVTLDKIHGSNQYGDLLGIIRGAWVLTSGINFYYSPLHLKNAAILNTNSEDAINLIHSEFVFDSSEFAYSYADAFDSDFSDGEILNCSFHDIGGDAIDVSGSELLVVNAEISNIMDKGISAGEESFITVKGANLKNVVIGVASKDLSEVSLEDVIITEASTAALAAYIKKNVYGPASISATDLQIVNSPTEAIVQTGCEIRVDGEKYQTVELDVKDLYERGILGN